MTLTQLPAQATRRSQRPPAHFPLVSIKATGSQRYTSQDIADAIGMQPGQTVSDSEFHLASELLGESGAFSSVTYSYAYSADGARLELQLIDIDQFLPAYFENFVWFSNQGLIADLHSRVPLFKGQLPSNGKLADRVSDALQSLLVEHNVQGRVDYLRAGPDNGPIEAFVFTVSGPTIRIGKVEFKGADPKDLPLLQTASVQLQGREYVQSAVKAEAEKNFTPVYQAQGYLKANFSNYQLSVMQQSDQETEVAVTFTVAPGQQYKAKEIQLTGSKVLPEQQLRGLIHQQLGQPANSVQMARDIEAVKKLYGTHGYMAVSIKLTPTLDDATSTVSYKIQVQEGDQYHMGDLDIQDLDRRDRSAVEARWALAKGDPYDSSYPKRFTAEILKDVLTTGEWNVSVRELPDPADKSVDVSVKFERREEL